MDEVYLVNDEAYEEWREWRRAVKKKKITPDAEKRQRKFLSNYPEPVQAAIIEKSMMNEYQGLFALSGREYDAIMQSRRTVFDGTSTRHRTLEEDLTDTSWANP